MGLQVPFLYLREKNAVFIADHLCFIVIFNGTNNDKIFWNIAIHWNGKKFSCQGGRTTFGWWMSSALMFLLFCCSENLLHSFGDNLKSVSWNDIPLKVLRWTSAQRKPTTRSARLDFSDWKLRKNGKDQTFPTFVFSITARKPKRIYAPNWAIYFNKITLFFVRLAP